MPKVWPKGAQRLENGTPGSPKWCHKGVKKLKMEGLDIHFLRVETYADRLLRSPLQLPVPGEGGENLRWFPPIPSQAKSMVYEIPGWNRSRPPFRGLENDAKKCRKWIAKMDTKIIEI